MNVRHVPIHADLAMPLALGKKTVTRRPMKPQPIHADGDSVIFGHGGEGNEIRFWFEDYPCPFGSRGDLLVFYFDGNPNGFVEAKHMGMIVERLMEITDEDAKKEGFDNRANFIEFWDKIYGDGEFSSHFNPWVWRIQFCKN